MMNRRFKNVFTYVVERTRTTSRLQRLASVLLVTALLIAQAFALLGRDMPGDANSQSEEPAFDALGVSNGPAESEMANAVLDQSVTNLKFDFGSTSSPVAAGYQQVANTMLYTSERGYGIDGTAAFRDRGAPDDLRRDFTNGTYGFKVDLPNGDYYVKIISGDNIAGNRTDLSIEGRSYPRITSASGSFAEFTTVVTVVDGQMNFAFRTDGRANAIEIVAISAPTGLRVDSLSLTADPAVTLGWEPVDGAASYTVYRALEGETVFAPVGSATSTSYTDETVELGLTYVYAVSQVNSAGIESAQSEPLTVAVKDPSVSAPSAPTGLRLDTATQDAITMQWNAANDTLLYYVYQSDAQDGPFVRVATTTEPRYTDATTPTTANHYYHVVAVNQGGLSASSNVLKTPITKTLIRQMERLDRGLVAVPVEGGVLVSWRMLGVDPPDISFNLYRDGQKVNQSPIALSTNYLDTAGTGSSAYSVRAIVNGVEQNSSESVAVWASNHHDIPLEKPEGGTTPDGVAYTYRANDASVGDLDGDGQYEIVLKWDPSNSKDNSQAGYTGEVFLDAYELDGTLLWRIGMGRNIRAGAHYTQFLVYDFDGEGKAEVVAKTADGTTDGTGVVIGNPNADYRNASGYILSGPEYLTVFEGATGRALATTDYYPPRGNVGSWGDTYGNRVDRFLAGVAYLDGERPSFVMARGYYTRSVLAAYNFRDGQISRVWVFDSNDPGNGGYAGQGNHSLAVADVDGDGRDEITYGAMAVDDDGSPLYTTGLGHGDMHHLSDHDPSRPGLEYFQVHENKASPYGYEMRDARTGAILWGVRTGIDTGRGVAADIDPRYPGAEAWAIGGAWNSPTGGLHTVTGEQISTNIPPANFAVWWDGDLLREVLDHSYSDTLGAGVGTIGEWDYENSRLSNLLTAEGTLSSNSTKGNAALQADILGDWREEVLWRTEDSSALRLYTTPYVTEHRFVTLMHDSVYRTGIAIQNVGYNQPPHLSYYLGEGMQTGPRPVISVGPVLPASVNVDPDMWNVRTGAGPRSATVYLELPQGYDVANAATTTVRLFVDGTAIAAQPSPVAIGDHNGNGIPDLMVQFDGRAFASALAQYNGTIEVSVIGYLVAGEVFAGSDRVRVMN